MLPRITYCLRHISFLFCYKKFHLSKFTHATNFFWWLKKNVLIEITWQWIKTIFGNNLNIIVLWNLVIYWSRRDYCSKIVTASKRAEITNKCVCLKKSTQYARTVNFIISHWVPTFPTKTSVLFRSMSLIFFFQFSKIILQNINN